MADINKWFALSTAKAIDGLFDASERPYLRDINYGDIRVVLPVKYLDPEDSFTEKDGFEVYAWSRKEIKVTVYLFDSGDYATIDALKTFLETQVDASSQTLEKYENWKKLNLYKTISPEVDILVNNTWIKQKVFVPDTGDTDLYVDLGHTIMNDIFTVSGDQSVSKTFYYTGDFPI